MRLPHHSKYVTVHDSSCIVEIQYEHSRRIEVCQDHLLSAIRWGFVLVIVFECFVRYAARGFFCHRHVLGLPELQRGVAENMCT